METQNYSLDDGEGNQITAGLRAHTARQTAQRMANERGKTLYLYPVPCPETVGPEAIEPESETNG